VLLPLRRKLPHLHKPHRVSASFSTSHTHALTEAQALTEAVYRQRQFTEADTGSYRLFQDVADTRSYRGIRLFERQLFKDVADTCSYRGSF
jgi:hypothetical protein